MTLRDMLIKHEDERLRLYHCPAGKLTIGVGRNIEDNGINHEESMIMLTNDINRVMAELDTALPWWRTLQETRRDVFVDMCFNMGLGGFRGFKKMIAAVQAGEYETAADEMLASKWAGQVGMRAFTLAAMMRPEV